MGSVMKMQTRIRIRIRVRDRIRELAYHGPSQHVGDGYGSLGSLAFGPISSGTKSDSKLIEGLEVGCLEPVHQILGGKAADHA